MFKILPRTRGAPGAMVGQTRLPYVSLTSPDRSQASRRAILGPFWALLGPLGAILESRHIGKVNIYMIQRCFNGFGVNLGAIFRPSWGHLGTFWGHRGAILGHPGASWGRLGPSWAILVPSWGHLGLILGHLGATLGPHGSLWNFLEPSRGHLRHVLAPFWGHLGVRVHCKSKNMTCSRYSTIPSPAECAKRLSPPPPKGSRAC